MAAHTTKKSWFSCDQQGTCSYTSNPTLGAIASFSSHGPRRDNVIKPDISAPGFGVHSTHSDQSGAIGLCGDADDGVHEINQGTSFSSPHVAGAVALFLSCRPKALPNLVKRSITQHSKVDGFTGTVPNATWGYGKLDAYAMMDHTPPTCHVLAPNGGETYQAGSTHLLTWTATDSVSVDSLRLEYTIDNGAHWIPRIDKVPNTGSYLWVAPNAFTSQAKVRVTAIDDCMNVTSDASDATFTLVGTVAAPDAPLVFHLGRSRPNPSKGLTSFDFSLPRAEDASLEIYDLGGRRVATVVHGQQGPGEHRVSWDSRDVASGVYFYRLTAGGETAVRKLLVAR